MGVENNRVEGATVRTKTPEPGWLKRVLEHAVFSVDSWKQLEAWLAEVQDNPNESTEVQLTNLGTRIQPHLETYKAKSFFKRG